MAIMDRSDRVENHHLPPVNFRDASVRRDATTLWSQPPTNIPTPGRAGPSSNHSHLRLGKFTPWPDRTRWDRKPDTNISLVGQRVKPKPGGVATPFSRATMGNHSNFGNQTASKTILNRGSNKRTKSMGNSTLGSGLHKSMAGGSNKVRIPNPLEVIDIEDEDDEDRGVVVQSDEMNITDEVPFESVRSEFGRNFDRPRSHPFDEYDSFSSSRHPIIDGEATKELEKKFDLISSDEPDDISQFTDKEPPPHEITHLKGNVREKVAKIEDKKISPRIDLRVAIKAKMKPKNPGTQRDPIATSSGKPLAVKQSTPPIVHVKEWFLGTEHRKSDAGYNISWEAKSGGMIIIKENKAHPESTSIAFKVAELDRMESTHYPPIGHAPELFIQLHTLALKKADDRNTDRFKLGDKEARGKILFRPDPNEWHDEAYIGFLNFLKPKINSSIIRPKAAEAIWKRAMECRDLAEVGQKRKAMDNMLDNHHPKKRRIIQDDGDDTPPPVGELSHGSSSRHGGTLLPYITSESNASRKKPESKKPSSVVAPRRSSRQAGPVQEHAPSVDSDEVILCYPQGVPGAVNITQADFGRLQPGEFLNDTLIEFGLKLWLRRLEGKDPELAQQIHVFSSFFYKKLNKRDIEEGYKSVRKWTSKFDIFSKKYIIIPINENLHWYLAIIYQPEHILVPPVVVEKESPSTRRKAHMLDNAKPFGNPPKSTPPSPPQDETMPQDTPSDIAVEKSLLNFDASCSITVTSEDTTPRSSVTEKDSTTAKANEKSDNFSSPLTDMDAEDGKSYQARRVHSPTISEYQDDTLLNTPHVHDVDMEDTASSSQAGADEVATKLFENNDVKYASASMSVEPQNFYGGTSEKAMGKRKMNPQYEEHPVVVDDEEEKASPSSALVPTTYIFVLDSLGSKHPQAIRQLSRYLKLEAQDKRGLSDLSDPQGKSAFVPVQPNYCDCGLYLLHFAQTFVTDPVKYCHIIKTTTKNTPMPTRQDDWRDSETIGMRERISQEIIHLSIDWKRERAEKEDAKKKEEDRPGAVEVVESSDDEVDIVETIPERSPKKKKGKGARNAPASARGKVNRHTARG